MNVINRCSSNISFAAAFINILVRNAFPESRKVVQSELLPGRVQCNKHILFCRTCDKLVIYCKVKYIIKLCVNIKPRLSHFRIISIMC